MKRSLTAAAAAVLTGAGVVGTAGAAAATPEFPAELPVDNGLAQTVFHGAGTLHGVQKTVGDVVSAPASLAEQAGQQAGQPRTGAQPTDQSPGNPIGETLDGLTEAHTHPVPTRGAHLPLDGVLPGDKQGAQRSAPSVRGIDDLVTAAGDAVTSAAQNLPPEAVNQNVQADNGKPGKPGMHGQSGQNGQPGGASSAVNQPSTKPAPQRDGGKSPYLLDLSNAGGAIGKPVADSVAQTPLAPLVNLDNQG